MLSSLPTEENRHNSPSHRHRRWRCWFQRYQHIDGQAAKAERTWSWSRWIYSIEKSAKNERRILFLKYRHFSSRLHASAVRKTNQIEQMALEDWKYSLIHRGVRFRSKGLSGSDYDTANQNTELRKKYKSTHCFLVNALPAVNTQLDLKHDINPSWNQVQILC